MIHTCQYQYAKRHALRDSQFSEHKPKSKLGNAPPTSWPLARSTRTRSSIMLAFASPPALDGVGAPPSPSKDSEGPSEAHRPVMTGTRRRAGAAVGRTPPSAKAKGKQKAIAQDDASGAEAMNVDAEVEDDGAGTEDAEPPRKRQKVTPRAVIASRATRHAVRDDQAGSSSEDDDDDEEDDDEGQANTEKLLAAAQAAEAQSEGFVKTTDADAYFLAQARPAKTSANQLSLRPGKPWVPFTVASYLEALDAADHVPSGQRQVQVREAYCERYKNRWRQWLFELSQGFSILFHGLGSKREVVNAFAKAVLRKDGDVVVVNGFHLGSSVSDVLDAIEQVAAGSSSPSTKVKARAHAPLDALEARALRLARRYSARGDFVPRTERKTRPLYLVLHNIDGALLRTSKAQAVLTILAAQPGIRVVATMDHVHGTFLFPTQVATARPPVEVPGATSTPTLLDHRGYNFIYHHIPTFAPYTAESLLDGTMSRILPPPLFPPTVGPSAGKGGSRRLATSKAVLHVLASLTKKAHSLFRMLAQRQLDAYSNVAPEQLSLLASQLAGIEEGAAAGSTPPVAISSKKLFTAAKYAFLASADSQLEALLAEFRDHNVVLGNREPPEGLEGESGAQGGDDDELATDGEWLWIAMERDALNDVLKQMEE